MNRIDGLNYVADLFGAGKNGFRDGDLATAVLPTYLNAKWFNAMQEECMSVIEGAGLVPDHAVRTQVRQAIKRMAGSNFTIVNAANTPLALGADHAGIVFMDGTAGNIVANLPAANVLAVPVKYRFVRFDATANTATVNAAGADTLPGVGTGFTLLGLSDFRAIESDTTSKWLTTSVSPTSFALGQCQLSLSGANLILLPKNGNKLTVNGVACTIPSAGVTLAPPAVASTHFYIYATAVNGVVTALEASATGHSADATVGANQGVEIKTGSPTRSLVGQGRTTAGSAWDICRSWFNRLPQSSFGQSTSAHSTRAGTPGVAFAPEARCFVLMWAGELLDFSVNGGVSNSNTNTGNYTTAAANGGANNLAYSFYQPSVVTYGSNCACAGVFVGLPEGYTYVDLKGYVSAGTGSWDSGTSLTITTR